MGFDPDAYRLREYRRTEAVRQALTAVDGYLLDQSDGSVEMTNSLTLGIALALLGVVGRGFDRTTQDLFLLDAPRTAVLVKCLAIANDHFRGFPEEDPRIRLSLWFHLAEEYVRKVGCFVGSDVMRHDQEHPAASERR